MNDRTFVAQTVAESLRVCFGLYIVIDIITTDAQMLQLIVRHPHLLLRAPIVGQCICLLIQTFAHTCYLLVGPLVRLLAALEQHYAATVRVRRMAKLPADDQRLEDACSVCLTSMDADSARLTPCGHTFHAKCLELSLRVLRDCPICRQPILPTV